MHKIVYKTTEDIRNHKGEVIKANTPVEIIGMSDEGYDIKDPVTGTIILAAGFGVEIIE